MLKKSTALLLAISSFALIESSNAAISMVVGNTGGPHLYIGNIGTAGFAYNTVPAGSFANIYWDSDNNGVFGETGKGENTGNGAALGFSTGSISSGTSFYFGLEGFATVETPPFGADFDIHNTDASVQRVQVLVGTPKSFTDSNGDQWEATFVFNRNAYGNVVQNTNTGAGGSGDPNDHQGILTFTQVPEPSSSLFAGLALAGVLLRRRR